MAPVKEPSYGHQLRQRLAEAVGTDPSAFNSGLVYMTLNRMERAGLAVPRAVARPDGADRRVYDVTPAGTEVVQAWMADTAWGDAALVNFHLKLVAASATRMADPLSLIDAQRRALLRQLASLQRLIADLDSGADAAVLHEGTAMRLQSDIRWLELCERHWERKRSQ